MVRLDASAVLHEDVAPHHVLGLLDFSSDGVQLVLHALEERAEPVAPVADEVLTVAEHRERQFLARVLLVEQHAVRRVHADDVAPGLLATREPPRLDDHDEIVVGVRVVHRVALEPHVLGLEDGLLVLRAEALDEHRTVHPPMQVHRARAAVARVEPVDVELPRQHALVPHGLAVEVAVRDTNAEDERVARNLLARLEHA